MSAGTVIELRFRTAKRGPFAWKRPETTGGTLLFKPDTLALTALLALLTALGPLSTDMYLPSLPSIGRDLAASTSEVQLTLSLFLVGFAVGQIVYGPVSDRVGRKPVLVAGVVLFGVASVLCTVAWSIETLIAARFLQAVGASGPIVLARSIVRDLYEGPRAGQELSRMGSIMGLVPAVAPVVGGLLETAFGWRSSFAATVLIAIGAFWLVTLRLPETLPRRDPTPLSFTSILRSFAGLIRERHFRLHALLVAATYGGLFAYISGSSFVLQGLYGLSELVYGFAFGVCALAYVGGTLIGRRLVGALGMPRSVTVGAGLMAFGGIAMAAAVAILPAHPLEIVVPMMIYMVGVGVGLPIIQAAALMPYPDRAGAASSLIGFSQMTFGAVVGIVVGLGVGSTAWSLVGAVAGLGLLALAAERMIAATRGA